MTSDIREKLDRQQIYENVAALLQPVIVNTLHTATRTCLTCDHFKEHSGEVCGLYHSRPPARIIAFGCPSYENEIPF